MKAVEMKGIESVLGEVSIKEESLVGDRDGMDIM